MNDDERWQRLKRLLAEAEELSTDERLELIERECRDETERRELKSLLQIADQEPVEVSAFLESAAVPDVEGHLLPKGTRVKAFRILEPLGAGGMGDVYLAERADGAYEDLVAIKVIRLQAGPSELQERFLSERRLMAELKHPNIASMLDAGTLADGRPYFVMELIDGIPLDAYCEHHGLGVRDRIRLFRQITVAVAHAHQKLVVHRDLKPANVLVDKNGVPKLLDFGIAKDLSDLGKTPSTRLITPMTPEYASPEQLTGHPVGTTADVYALGVILYELLTGTNPFGDQKNPLDGRSKKSPPTLPSRRRPADPTRDMGFARELRGDLDQLILKAMAPEPADRYPSAEALGRDLRHFLDGSALDIREGRFYRLGKWALRYRWTLLFTLTITAALVGWRMETEKARQAAENQRLVTEHTEKLGTYLIDVLVEGRPKNAGERSASFERMIDKAVSLLEQGSFEVTPKVRAALLSVVGTSFTSLGRFEQALPHLQESLDLRRSALLPDHPKTAASINNLALCMRGLERFEEARGLMLESIEILGRKQQKATGTERLALMKNLMINWNNLAGIEKELGRTERAVELYQKALELKEEIQPNQTASLSRANINLSSALLAAGRFDDAADHLEKAQTLLNELPQDASNRPAIRGSLWHHQGILARSRRDHHQARLLFKKAWEEREALYGPKHKKTQASLAGLKSVENVLP